MPVGHKYWRRRRGTSERFVRQEVVVRAVEEGRVLGGERRAQAVAGNEGGAGKSRKHQHPPTLTALSEQEGSSQGTHQSGRMRAVKLSARAASRTGILCEEVRTIGGSLISLECTSHNLGQRAKGVRGREGTYARMNGDFLILRVCLVL